MFWRRFSEGIGPFSWVLHYMTCLVLVIRKIYLPAGGKAKERKCTSLLESKAPSIPQSFLLRKCRSNQVDGLPHLQRKTAVVS